MNLLINILAIETDFKEHENAVQALARSTPSGDPRPTPLNNVNDALSLQQNLKSMEYGKIIKNVNEIHDKTDCAT